jgi:hypothetical protein
MEGLERRAMQWSRTDQQSISVEGWKERLQNRDAGSITRDFGQRWERRLTKRGAGTSTAFISVGGV